VSANRLQQRTVGSPTTDPVHLVNSFTVVIDQREQAPFGFHGLTASAADGNAPLVIPTNKTFLATGDYSIEGLEAFVTVERKSVQDLIGTLTAGRERFEAELERASKMEFAAVVIEGGWDAIVRHLTESAERPGRRPIPIRSVVGSVIAWQQRYPSIHWWPCADRRMAEAITFRILERFWNERAKKVNERLREMGGTTPPTV
jgi:DNA excision repair protein ERCC-4